MPVVEASVTVPVPPDVAFTVSQTTGETRYRWDPFIRFAPAAEPGHTVATWRYGFRCKPAFLRPLAEPIGVWLLGRDIRRRIAGFARGCTDPAVTSPRSGQDLGEAGWARWGG